MTKIRSDVLDYIEASPVPVSAGTIHDGLTVSCDLVSVYRTLRYLETEDLALSFTLHCEAHGTERYYYASSRHHTHWFHCRICHRFFDIGSAVRAKDSCVADTTARRIEQAYGFFVEEHSLNFTGVCGECGKKAKR
jgi:Fur family ferric uptake transcriptional regulator